MVAERDLPMTDIPAPKPPDRHYVLGGTRFLARPLEPGLHVVATPIGNLRDITVRAVETLAAASLVACEDSRVTRRLVDHFGLTAKLVPYH